MQKLKYDYKTRDEVKAIRLRVREFTDAKVTAVPVYGYNNSFNVVIVVSGANLPDCLENTVAIRNSLKNFC